jgi:hypothetical protein
MNRDSGDSNILAHSRSRDFGRLVKAREKRLKGLSDAEFISWDKALLACPKPGFSEEDEGFAVLNLAMGNERRRRRDKHSGIFGWRRLLTPDDREIWLKYYAEAARIDSNRPERAQPLLLRQSNDVGAWPSRWRDNE